MEDPKIKRLSDAQFRAEEEKKQSTRFFWWMFWISLALMVGSAVLFFWHHGPWFVWEGSVNVELLASLGEFIGGVLGSLIAAVSIFMVVKTLHAQVDANAKTEDNNKTEIQLNKQQLFDNKFQVLYEQYKDAIAAYGPGHQGGKQNLEAVAANFLAQPFTCDLVYSLRVKSAVKLFEEFYARNRMCCSVHFRVLYQLIRFIDSGEIEDEDRVIYAKSIRGQLSDGEMALLRYNCMTPNGFAMQRYVNHYNLLKHVPLMSLFEFKRWANKIPDIHEKAALDATFITLRKMMKNHNENDAPMEITYEISLRYKIIMVFEQGHRCMIFRVEENKKAKSGGPVKHPYTENALKKIGDAELLPLFSAFLYETFITSNFGLFENAPNSVHSPIEVEKTKDSFIFEIEVKGPQRLVLSQDQYTPAARN